MSYFWRNTVLLGLCGLLIGIFVLPADAQMVWRQRFNHDGERRFYRLYVPDLRNHETPVPLVVALHGGGGNSRSMMNMTDFNTIAEREGFAVLYPEGIDGNWNDLRDMTGRLDAIDERDDVGFLDALIDHIGGQYPIDNERIFATGISNGGLMSFRLACERADRYRAIAAVTAALPPQPCDPNGDISILVMNGTDDPLILWDGGDVSGTNDRGAIISTPATMDFWREQYACDDTPQITNLPDTDPDDGATVRVETYTSCTPSVEVVLYAIEGGGHTWPGGPQYAPVAFIGNTNRDINASEHIWQFFARQTTP